MKAVNFKANVSEFGLFRGAAKTRAHLIVSVIVVTAIEIGLALWSAHFILDESASVGLNLFLITFNMMWVLIAAYLQTILIGDIFFSGPWRERVILGKQVDGSVQDHNAEFMILLVALVIGNAVGLNYLSGGFFDTYENEGFFRAQLRSEDPSNRLAALVELGDVTNFELWENRNLQDLVAKHSTDDDDEVRARAAWTLGEMKASRHKDALVRQLSDKETAVRTEASHALGKLGNDENARNAIEAALSTAQNDQERVSFLRGLALMKSPLSGKTAWKYVEHENDDVALHAYWVLRNGADPQIRETLRERINTAKSPIRKCAAMDALKMVATDADTTWARRQFAATKEGVACEPLIWEDLNERQYYVTYSDSYRVKYLKIVANGTGAAHRGWFERIIADPEQPWRVREVANEIVNQIKDLER